MYKKIILKGGKEVAVQRLHPWIFSGAIAQTQGNPEDGDIVEVFDKKGTYLATGHYFDGSIAVKIFSYKQTVINEEFWFSKLENAYKIRKSVPLGQTNCFRLIHGEGDGMPGLIIDFYSEVAVFQAHTIGMWNERDSISNGLKKVFGRDLKTVYDKSKETLPEKFSKNIQNGYLWKADNFVELASNSIVATENGNKFIINWETGQKTGFFLDQRDNRALLAQYANGKKVLNSFCYSGGFSIYALRAGATYVHSVDVSKKAIDLVNENVKENFGELKNHEAFAEDVMGFLKRNDQVYDLMVLDPPAFAKSISKRHQAVQGYKRLNIEGIKRLAKGGILFTFSCSQVVDRQLFYDTIVAAALEVGRQVRVLHQLTQGADHPVNIFHPEGSYLKGLVLYVE